MSTYPDIDPDYYAAIEAYDLDPSPATRAAFIAAREAHAARTLGR